MRKIVATFILLCFMATVAAKDESDAVFREPFTLKLPIDKERYYEQKLDRIPYVHDNNVYLFVGENFGVNLLIENGKVAKVSYQKDITKADIEFKFYQELEEGGHRFTLLVIKNNIKDKIYFDGLMTVPDRKDIIKTSILPIEPGLSNYESWPHPIIQLVLKNIRLDENK